MGKADPNCWWLLIWELVTSMDCIFFFLSSQQPCKGAPSQKRQVILSGWSVIKVRTHVF